MSAEARSASYSSSASRAALGTGILILALPVLYLLSVPPLTLCSLRTQFPSLDWILLYQEPYVWLCQHPPLHHWLNDYYLWWLGF